MKALALTAVLVFGLAAPAWAVGPVVSPNTCGVQWDAPTTNADATALTDLAQYRIYVATQAGAPGTLAATVAATAPAPAPNTVVTWLCTGLTEGQKYVTVTAVDLAGNESGRSAELPFVFDAGAPSAPRNLRIGR